MYIICFLSFVIGLSMHSLVQACCHGSTWISANLLGWEKSRIATYPLVNIYVLPGILYVIVMVMDYSVWQASLSECDWKGSRALHATGHCCGEIQPRLSHQRRGKLADRPSLLSACNMFRTVGDDWCPSWLYG